MRYETMKQFPPMIYVAGPYTGDVVANIQRAEEVSITLIRNGWHVITPHKNTAGYEQYENGTTITKSTWLEMDLNILERCDAMYVMDDYRASPGTMGEIGFAIEQCIPVYFEEIDPAEMFTPETAWLVGRSK